MSTALGNGTWQHWNFNDRLQVTEIGVGSAAGNSSVWGLQYTYPQTQNNGNVTGERIVGPGIDIPRTYQYDRLNRLARYDEPVMYKEFSFGRYGNRANTAFAPANLDGNYSTWPNSLASYSTTTNRFTTSPYNTYDAAGNEQVPNYTQTWDAENRHVTNTSSSSFCSGAAGFDGEGRLVKSSCLPGWDYLVVYDAFGARVADYVNAGSGNETVDEQRVYVAREVTGSYRLLALNANGVRRWDWDPLGNTALPCQITGVPPDVFRCVNNAYQTAAVPELPEFAFGTRFDTAGIEIQMGARAFGVGHPASGRFNSPDEPMVDQQPEDPQSWNLYTYARNNPLGYTDPTGRCSKDNQGGYWDADDKCALLFKGACSGQTIQGEGRSPLTVGVGGDEARLIMLQSIGENLSSPNQWAEVAKNGTKGAATVLAPLAASIAQCVTDTCDQTSLAMAAIPGIAGTSLQRFASSRKLRNILRNWNRTGTGIGSGSTADAIRHEIQTGIPVGGKFHFQKGEEIRRALRRLFRDPTLDPSDRALVKELRLVGEICGHSG